MTKLKTNWKSVKLQYNKIKNQWQMVYTAKAIPQGKDAKGIMRYKPIRKTTSISLPQGYHRTHDAKTKAELKLTRQQKDHNKHTEKILKQMESQYQVDLTNKVFHINQNSGSNEKLSDWVEKYYIPQRNLKPNTLKRYAYIINVIRNISDARFFEIDSNWVDKINRYWLIRVKDGTLKQTSFYGYSKDLMCFIAEAWKKGKIESYDEIKNKATKVAMGSHAVGKYFSLEQLRILDKTECRYPLLKRAFLFNCITGLRFSETKSLKWGDVIERDGTFRITIRERKTGNNQVINVASEAMQYAGERRRNEEFIFNALTYSDANHKLTEWVATALPNYGKTTTHDCRRTCASLIWKESKNINLVARHLNHKNPLETAKYLQRFLTDTYNDADADDYTPKIRIS